MTKTVKVESLSEGWPSRGYDMFICTLGYERRARYIAEEHMPKAKVKVALGFQYQQVYSFESNADWFRRNVYQIVIVSDADFRHKLQEVFTDCAQQEHCHVLVDISSISRYRLAVLIEALASLGCPAGVSVDFVYALAAYNPPFEEVVANSHVGPVSPSFAGWWQDPNRAVSAIVGLGYEEDRALGAVEYLQAAEIWAFVPVSSVHEYSPAIARANEQLLMEIPPERQLRYRVNDPLDCYTTLQSLVYGLTVSRNPILLPFGPKLFALCCLLVGVVSDHVPVWRVSAQELEPAVDRRAEGPVFGLSTTFEANQAEQSRGERPKRLV